MKKSKLFLALCMVIGMTVLVGGSTLALFSAQSATSNTFTAGTLTITTKRDDGQPVPGPMFFVNDSQGMAEVAPGVFVPPNPNTATGLWAPGDSHAKTLIVENPRTADNLDAYLTSVQATLNAGSDAELADEMYVSVYYLNKTVFPPQAIDVAHGYLSDFVAGPVLLKLNGQKIPVSRYNGAVDLQFLVAMDQDAGNQCQDKTLVANFIVNAEQQDNNTPFQP